MFKTSTVRTSNRRPSLFAPRIVWISYSGWFCATGVESTRTRQRKRERYGNTGRREEKNKSLTVKSGYLSGTECVAPSTLIKTSVVSEFRLYRRRESARERGRCFGRHTTRVHTSKMPICLLSSGCFSLLIDRACSRSSVSTGSLTIFQAARTGARTIQHSRRTQHLVLYNQS